MHSLFWRIFFSFWLLLLALAAASVAISVTLNDRGGFVPFVIQSPSTGQSSDDRPPPPREVQINNFSQGQDQSPPPRPDDGNTRPQGDNGLGNPPPPPGPDNQGQSDQNPPHGEPRSPDSLADDMHHIPPHEMAVQIYEHGGKAAVTAYFAQLLHHNGMHFYLFDDSGTLLAGDQPDLAIRGLERQAISQGHVEILLASNLIAHADLVRGQSGRNYVFIDAPTPPTIDIPSLILRIVILLLIASLVCWGLTKQITRPIFELRRAAQDIAHGRFQTRVMPWMSGRRDEIGTLANDFDTMAQRLESLVTAQNRLLADVSHELRSPLARLTLASALARRGAEEGTQKSLDRVDQEAERLNEMIGQLTALSRLEIDSAGIGNERIDVKQLVAEIVADTDYEARATNKRVSLESQIPEAYSPTIVGSRDLLRSAIENVVRNAVRYTHENTIVTVSISRSDQSVMVSVRDHGVGVPPAQLEDIFRPFYRTAYARDRDSGGVGLGLAITERAVRRHGGKVVASNADGGGLHVEFDFPMSI